MTDIPPLTPASEEADYSWEIEVNAHLDKLDRKVLISFGLGAGACLLSVGANVALMKTLKMLQGMGELLARHDAFLRGEVSATTASTSRPNTVPNSTATRTSVQDAGAVADVASEPSTIRMNLGDKSADETVVREMETEHREGPASEISDEAREALENDALNPGSMLHGDISLAPKPLPPLPGDEYIG